jgi:hypothetical protein
MDAEKLLNSAPAVKVDDAHPPQKSLADMRGTDGSKSQRSFNQAEHPATEFVSTRPSFSLPLAGNEAITATAFTDMVITSYFIALSFFLNNVFVRQHAQQDPMWMLSKTSSIWFNLRTITNLNCSFMHKLHLKYLSLLWVLH